MSDRKPRPETPEDLPPFLTEPVVVARVQLYSAGGVLSAADQLIAAYQAVPELAGQVLTTLTEDRQVVISRHRTDAELDAALTDAQTRWDSQNAHIAAAEARAALKVGDPLDVSTVRDGLSCGHVFRKAPDAAPCSLDLDHVGDHFEVVEGRITRISPR